MCAGCGNELFSSDAKFDSPCGWPSFSEVDKEAVDFWDDTSLGMKRTEVFCNRCQIFMELSEGFMRRYDRGCRGASPHS